MAMLAILILPLMILGWTAVAVVIRRPWPRWPMPGRTASPKSSTPTPRSTGNNGSAFAGLTGNTLFYNITGAIAMLVGRFWMIVPAMAIAGSLAAKKIGAAIDRHVPDHGRPVRRPAGRRDPDRRRPHLLPGARAWARSSSISRCPPARCSEPSYSESWPWKPRNFASGCRSRRCSTRRSCFRRSARPSSSSTRATLIKNPVMFVLEVVTAADDGSPGPRPGHRQRQSSASIPDRGLAVVHGAVRQFRRSRGGGARQGAGGHLAQDAHRDAAKRILTPATTEVYEGVSADESGGRRPRGLRGRRHHPGRRRGDRRHRLGQRGGHHRRIRAGHPRIRRRPLGRDRRHHRHLRPHRRPHHVVARARPSSTA